MTIEKEKKKVKPFDLEERTCEYTKEIISFINSCPKTLANIEITRQLVRAAGSVGANYIEARELISKKDFVLRVKICRKEAKESAYWLRLVEVKADNEKTRQYLLEEANELLRIFSSIVEKTKVNNEKHTRYFTLGILILP